LLGFRCLASSRVPLPRASRRAQDTGEVWDRNGTLACSSSNCA